MVAPPPNPPNKPVSYPRPPLLNSPVRAKYGLGHLTTKAGEVYRKSIAYTQKAVTMASADLVLPRKAIEEGARASYDGLSMRIITDYLPQSDQLATRLDILFGKKYIRPEWLVVVADRV